MAISIYSDSFSAIFNNNSSHFSHVSIDFLRAEASSSTSSNPSWNANTTKTLVRLTKEQIFNIYKTLLHSIKFL